MKLADILKSDANALKLFSAAQISALEACLIPDEFLEVPFSFVNGFGW